MGGVVLIKTRPRQVPVAEDPDASGWLRYESRGARKKRLRELRGPRRAVPKDLRGRCFNYLAPSHRAADCQVGTRCFKCHQVGHRASNCAGRRRAPISEAPRRLLVWRPKAASAGNLEAMESAPGGESSGAAGGQGTLQKRRRRRGRKRRRSGAADQRGPPNQADDDSGESPRAATDVLAPSPGVPACRRCIIDRSARIARVEDELCNTLSVVIVGDTTNLSVDVLVAELARHHEPLIESLEFHRLCRDEGLLVLPDESTATRIYNDGRPLRLPPFILCFQRWSRFGKAFAVVLPSLIDIELSGISAHAWELETAEHLLDEWCWVRELHPDTIDRRDYSSFRLKAWCYDPELIPADMELVIVEPPVLVEEVPPLKRALKYDIKIKFALASTGVDDVPPPPPPPREDSDQGRRRRRRQTHASLEPASGAVFRRLSSGPVSGVHVADREGPFDGSQPPEPDATRRSSIPSDASSPPAVIDGLTVVVTTPRLGEVDAIPEIPENLVRLSADGPVFPGSLSNAVDEECLKRGSESLGPAILAQTFDPPTVFSGPEASCTPELLDRTLSPPRQAADASGSDGQASPVTTTLVGVTGGDGVVTAPLPDSHLSSVVAMAEAVDLAVVAMTPPRTPGPGGVEVMAATRSSAARSCPTNNNIHQLPPAAGTGLERTWLHEKILGGRVSSQMRTTHLSTAWRHSSLWRPWRPGHTLPRHRQVGS